MKNNKDCSAIRDMIEENVLRKNDEKNAEIRKHIEYCSECGKYMSDLVMLQPAAGYLYALPVFEKGRFSALVRTRIEARKNRNPKPAFAVRPAFQIALMILVVVSVVFYLFQSEPDQLFVFNQSELESITIYDPEYYTYIVHDEELMSLLYEETLFEGDTSMPEYWYNGYYGNEYFYGTDGLTDEELDYIIQRLREV